MLQQTAFSSGRRQVRRGYTASEERDTLLRGAGRRSCHQPDENMQVIFPSFSRAENFLDGGISKGTPSHVEYLEVYRYRSIKMLCNRIQAWKTVPIDDEPQPSPSCIETSGFQAPPETAKLYIASTVATTTDDVHMRVLRRQLVTSSRSLYGRRPSILTRRAVKEVVYRFTFALWMPITSSRSVFDRDILSIFKQGFGKLFLHVAGLCRKWTLYFSNQ